MLRLFFELLSTSVFAPRHWQTSGRLVQELNVCTVYCPAKTTPNPCHRQHSHKLCICLSHIPPSCKYLGRVTSPPSLHWCALVFIRKISYTANTIEKIPQGADKQISVGIVFLSRNVLISSSFFP